MSFNNCSFALTPLHEKAYELNVTFSAPQPGCVSKKTFVFEQNTEPCNSKILDIYSQNGTCPKKVVNHLFTKQKGGLFIEEDEIAIGQASQKWKEEEARGPSILVLDLKDSHKSYKNQPAIHKCETAFCDFLQGNPPVKLSNRSETIHQVFQKNLPVDFVLAEGSLKCKLLTQFSDAEAEYFLEGEKGRIRLCEYAEFYMNGGKFGQETKDISMKDYFLNVDPQGEAFEPIQESAVWYPKTYADVYSPNGSFYQTMKPVFDISGSVDPKTKISSVTVKRKYS